MPLETSQPLPLPEPVATQCSPSHRRTRRALSAVVGLLIFAIIALGVYCLWSSRT